MIRLYQFLTLLGAPLIDFLLWWRKIGGKEDGARLQERKGVAGIARPAGKLIWIHTASVGEALSALPLAQELLRRHPDITLLMTTGTVSSARILAKQLPARVLHQYVPVDRLVWVRRFLDYWQPDLGVWIESELWPNLVLETARRGIPMALINARMSARSYHRWRQAPDFIRQLLDCFCVILAHDERSAEYMRNLGGARAAYAGDLKQCAEPLAVEEAQLSRLLGAIAGRPVWVAASTHPGEEEIVAQLHQRLQSQFPGLLTILAPRHANRGEQISAKIARMGMTVVRRSSGVLPEGDTGIYLADTMGEMGLIYRLAKIAFVGGSLVPHGGQNPLEPARLACAILHGPHVQNFTTIYSDLDASGAARLIQDGDDLCNALANLLRDKPAATSRGVTAKSVAVKGRDKILEHIADAIEPLLAGRE
jgi:3-deoxy-D-manno-octulosonic-acid transferase